MLRNVFAASWRHLMRSRGHALIGVLGLALGLAAALLALLVVRDHRSRDHFIAGHADIYLVTTAVTPPGRATIYLPSVNTFVGPWLKERAGVQAAARLFLDNLRLRRGQVAAIERVYWADPDVFGLLPLPVLAGDLRTALQKPDAVVLSRAMARKYFGTDSPLGEVVQVGEGNPFTVTAVIHDLPPNGTHLQSGIFLSTLASASQLQRQDRIEGNRPGSPIGFGTNTYLRLASPAAAEQLRQQLPVLVDELFSRPPADWKMALRMLRMDELATDAGFNPGAAGRLSMTLAVGLGILAVAAINFINLLAGRWSRRLPEAGMRRLAGASRATVAAQFLGESLCYVTVAMLLAVALVEVTVPHANALLDTAIDFSYWRTPVLLAWLALATLAFGLLAGAWPALAMAGLSPLQMLKGMPVSSPGTALLRHGLVTIQFAILIGLIIAAGVVYQQRLFATRDAIRVDTDQVLVIRARCNALAERLRGLPGVREVACSDRSLLGGLSVMTMKARDGVEQLVLIAQVSPQLFDLYRVKPVAGQLGGAGGTYYVLNETAARRLGYSDLAQVVGVGLPATGRPDAAASLRQVRAVMPDFSLTSVEQKIEALAYVVNDTDPGFDLINVRLAGQQVPQTLSAIEAIWRDTGAIDPLPLTFLKEHIQRLYAAMLMQARMFAGFALLAVVLASIGLFGLAASVAERRTREIGIRKALGASTGDVLRMLLWQFSRPVLWANLLAWPVAAWFMQRWLDGFAYHVALPLWLFPAAALLALLLALATVSAHAARVARARPVGALRHG